MLLSSGKQIETLFLFWYPSKTPIEKKRRETDQVLGGEVECIHLTVSDPNPWSRPGASGERERALGLQLIVVKR